MMELSNNTLYNSKSLFSMLRGTGIYDKLYIFLFLTFSFQVIPNNIVLALIVVVFLISDLETNIFLYLFSLPWMYVGKFSFGITISLINTVVVVGKICFIKKRIKLTILEWVVFIYLLLLGLVALVNDKSFTGISICFYFFVSSYFSSYYAGNKTKSEEFWRKCFFFIFLSTSISIIYGLRANTGFDRWISGMGYVTQLYGTLGTSRLGLYLAVSLIFPLYYIRNKIEKVLIASFLVLALFSTVSITSLLMLIFVLGYYFITTGKMNIKKIATILLVILGVVIILLLWDRLGNIGVFKPMYTRVNMITNQIETGDIDRATSGRTLLSDVYINRFESFGLLKKIFGGATLSVVETAYSHNSYLDMLSYCGIVGVILLILLQFQRISVYIHIKEKKQVLLTKSLFIIVAMSVSIFSAQYWLIFFFI